MDNAKKTIQIKNLVSYDFRRLISTRYLRPSKSTPMHIICDIDKTYLDTKTEGAIQVLKIAFEDAKDKITISGAAQFLLAARWGNPWSESLPDHKFEPKALHFLSASPPQLRRTIETKLTQDGLDWNSDSFKNQVYNIRKGKLNLLRHHIAYKTACALQLIQNLPAGSQLYLIGDSAEYDAFIYLNIGLYLAGKIDTESYCSILCASGVEKNIALDLLSIITDKPNAKVTAIFIRNVVDAPFVKHLPLTEPIVIFNDYFEASLIAIKLGLIDPTALIHIARLMHNHCGLGLKQILAQLKTALNQYFTPNDTSYEFINETFLQILEISSLQKDDIPVSQPILPQRSIDDIGLTQEEIVKHAIVWAKKLADR